MRRMFGVSDMNGSGCEVFLESIFSAREMLANNAERSFIGTTPALIFGRHPLSLFLSGLKLALPLSLP